MPIVIKIPEELAHDLDRLAGAEHKPRATYVIDLLWRDVRLNKQREALRLSSGPGIPRRTLNLLRAGPLTSIRSGPKQMSALQHLLETAIVDGHCPTGHLRHLRAVDEAVGQCSRVTDNLLK